MQEPPAVAAVLFDRDGTLVHDVPYNGDPALVRLVDGAVAALARLRAAGVLTGVVTNQSGVGRGLVSREEAEAVTAEVVRRVGGVDVVRLCPHAPDDGCACRKPAPGMVLSAAAELALPAQRVAVVGDRGSDVAAGLAAGAHAVLVPGPATGAREVAAAPVVVPDLAAAVDHLLALPVPAAR